MLADKWYIPRACYKWHRACVILGGMTDGLRDGHGELGSPTRPEQATRGARATSQSLAERFEALLTEQAYGMAWRYCQRLCLQAGGGRSDAEDLLQEALTRAYLGLHALREESRFAGWLLAVVRRRHFTRLKAQRGEPLLVADPSADRGFAAAYEAQSVEAQLALEALARLPDGPRELLALTCLDGLSPLEAAAVLGIAPRAVRMRLTRARKLLRAAYRGDIPLTEHCSGRTT
jgi:RNA polymerase sigma factor (sigma-70 family)